MRAEPATETSTFVYPPTPDLNPNSRTRCVLQRLLPRRLTVCRLFSIEYDNINSRFLKQDVKTKCARRTPPFCQCVCVV